ncbi:MAG: single-stranded-DNA-specific exonuclease RecJ [Gammaproteobacteria bacterium]|nr:single-stranded-DNA-specific exonuclease RecJ [Gammaproteobacteria bacterium]
MKVIRRIATSPSLLPDHLHPVLKRIYATRGINSAQELDYALAHLHSPAAFASTQPLLGESGTGPGGMEHAVALLAAALADNKRIVIVADFDADGATSCAFAIRALRLMGAQDVRYVVPDRFKYGYGLTPEIVMATAPMAADLLITVDNGISSIEGVRTARQLGLQVVITDHHLPGAELPAADAIVNPNLPEEDFPPHKDVPVSREAGRRERPSKHLAGVGVIFYVMLALRAHLRTTHWFHEKNIPDPNLAQLLDLVALGTVADVVPLDHNNRILVAQGLQRIRSGRCIAGIRALLTVAGKNVERICASDLAFSAAPRLNAAGRLEDMALGIECLLCDDYTAALDMAQRLDTLNRERRSIESEMQEQALSALKSMRLDTEAALPHGLCLFDPDWHQGVIGILAARIKERTHRPVIAFAPASEHDIKGSARSVPGLHIRDVLDSVAARHPGLLTKFGGHAMAAGLSLRRADFETFSAAFDAEVRRHLSADALQGSVQSDGELSADELRLEVAEMLRNADPWGQGFPEPLFDGEFEILNQRRLGGKHLKLSVRHPQGQQPLDAIAFNIAEDDRLRLENSTRAHLVYKLDVNDYRGQRSLQLIIEHAVD